MFRFEDPTALHPTRRTENLQESGFFVDSRLGLLQTLDQSIKSLQIPLPKLKIEIWSTISKDDPFCHCYNDKIELSKRQIWLLFCFGIHKTWILAIKKIELHAVQLILTEHVNLKHREIYHYYNSWFYLANKIDKVESN